MSLDIYLRLPGETEPGEPEEKIFVRIGGQNKEVTREEYEEMYPGRMPVAVVSPRDDREVFTANITHNLSEMARACGLYDPLWNPEEKNWTKAEQLVAPLRVGLYKLVCDPMGYKEFNPVNGWGDYALLLQTASDLLDACQRWPDAVVSVWK